MTADQNFSIAEDMTILNSVANNIKKFELTLQGGKIAYSSGKIIPAHKH
jgi:hypothetical protein